MANLDSLIVRLEADTTQLTRELRRLDRTVDRSTSENSKRFDRLNRSVDGAGKVMRRLAGAAVALAGAAGLGRLVTSSLDAADSLADVADKIGVNVEALQELRGAAQQAGVEQATLDMALQRFSRRVGEAANGTGELRATLEQYDIAVRNADGSMRPLEAILADYADTIQGAESDQERLRLAFKAFDSEGAALVNMLRDGSAGLSEMRQEMRDLGIVIDEETVRAAADLNDKLDLIRMRLGSSMQQAILNLVPIIDVAAEAFADLAGRIGWVLQGFLDLDRQTSKRLEFDLADAKTELDEVLQELNEILRKRDEIFGIGRAPDSMGGARISLLQGRRDKLQAEIARIEAELSDRATPADRPGSGGGGGGDGRPPAGAGGGSSPGGAEAARLRAMREQIEAIERQGADFRAEMGRIGESIRADIETPMERANRIIREAQQALAWGTITQDEFALFAEQVERDAVTAMERASEAAEDFGDVGEEAFDRLDAAAQNFAGEFDRTVLGVLDGTMTMRQGLLSLLDDVQGSLLSMVTGGKGIGGTLLSLVQGGFNMMVGAGGVNGLVNTGFSNFSSVGTGATLGGSTGGFSFGLAGGGRAQPKTPIMVGERGPELFTPDGGGVVTANGALNGMRGGSVNITQTFQVGAGASQLDRATMMAFGQQIKAETLAAVQEGNRRDPRFLNRF